MVWINKSNFLSVFAYSFKSSITKGWLNSWFRLVIYPRSVSFKVIDQSIRTTTKNKGEKESLWKIPLLISTSPRLSLHTISSVIHVSLLFSNTFTMLSAILTIFIASINQSKVAPYHRPFCNQSKPLQDYAGVSCSALGSSCQSRIGPSFLVSLSCIFCTDQVAHSSQIGVHIPFLPRH